MKKLLLPFLYILLHFTSYSQCLIAGGTADTSFLVTNTITFKSNSDGTSTKEEGGVYRMAKVGDTLYLLGNFTNLGPNHGRGVVFDTATKGKVTTAQWRIDGTVKTSVPDGRGGFYIGGTFTNIGDSSRPFLAQIDANGRPTDWKPRVNASVNALYKKGDTLFIGGSFTQVASQSRRAFAIYSLGGDTLMRQISPFETNSNVTVNVFKRYGDSLFIGGDNVRMAGVNSRSAVVLYNTRALIPTYWAINTNHFDYDITSMEVSPENGLLFYGHTSQNNLVAVDLLTGVEKYRLGVTLKTPPDSYGNVNALKVIGNKLFIGGNFNYIYPHSTQTARTGFCVLDIPSQNLLPVDAQLDGAVRHLEVIGDKLYVNGYFTSIYGKPREHQAELDTTTLALTNWNPAPSDPVLTISASMGKLFMGGEFSGIGTVHRNGLVAVDVRTNEVLPFNPLSERLVDVKRMLLQGDYLYVLHYTTRSVITRINRRTGAIAEVLPAVYFNDFNLDSNFLYAANYRGLERYRLSDLQRMPSWGIDYSSYIPDIYFTHLIVKDNKIFCLGIESQSYSNIPGIKFTIFDKASGTILKEWKYSAYGSYRDNMQGVFSGDSILYVQGNFNGIEGMPRKCFFAIDVRTGAITSWNPTFAENRSYYPDFGTVYSPLKLKDGKVWFGTTTLTISDGRSFWGMGAIDNVTGVLLPPSISVKGAIDKYSYSFRPTSVQDFIFDGDQVYVSGFFDKANSGAFQSLARFTYQPSTPPPSLSAISGPDTLFFGSDSCRYVLNNTPQESASYYWTYSGDSVQIKNNGGNTVWLKVALGASGGVLKARVVDYCGMGTEVQKPIVLVKKTYADLSLSSVTTAPPGIPQASTFTVQFTLVNSGDASSKASKVTFYVSKDTILTPGSNGDLLLGLYDGTARVAAADSLAALSISFKAPCTIGTGMFYLFAVADAQNTEEETNKTNNKAFIPFSITDGVTMPAEPVINAMPSASFCTGDSVQLALAGTPNPSYNYSWNSGETATVITVKTYGNYTLTATNGCGSASGSVYVSERLRPDVTVTASGATTFCAGGRVTLNVTPTYNSTYQWRVDGVSISGATTTSYSATTSGRYTVLKTYNDCPTVSAETVVTVNSIPSKPVITAAGNVLSSSATVGVQWYKGGVALPGATGTTYTATASGQYSVSTTQNGCTATSNPYDFVFTAIVNVNTWNSEVCTYPNPVGDQLFIANKAGRRLSVRLIDATGKSVYEGRITGVLGTIPTRHLGAGSYILLITDIRIGETIARVVVKQ